MAIKTDLKIAVMAIGVVLMGVGFVYADLNDGLVAHWALDGDAIDSAGSNHGTIYGATSTTGQIDEALDFDGVDDYVDFGDILNDLELPSTILHRSSPHLSLTGQDQGGKVEVKGEMSGEIKGIYER
jgi:hypothetical protein